MTSIVDNKSGATDPMSIPRLTKLELQIMDALWNKGSSSIREIQESFSEDRRPAYTTVQTTIYRLETKGAVRRAKKEYKKSIRRSARKRGGK